MERSGMYIRLLDVAIELRGFLSDIKHPENHELESSTVLQLMQERRHALSEHNRRVFEENCIICEEV